MRTLQTLRKGLGAAAAMAVALVGWTPSGALAATLPFQYAAGDIIAVINKGGVDLIMNLGQLPAVQTTQTYLIPSQFGGTLAGATFNGAFRVPDFNNFPEIVDFTTTSSLSFPDPNGDFAAGIGAANSSLAAPQTGWFALLPSTPDVPGGGSVLNRGSNILALLGSASYSYTTVIGQGTDAINSSLTNGVNTRIPFGTATSTSLPFYALTYDFDQLGNSVYQKQLLGTIGAAQSNGNVAVSFSPIPEPGTMLLLTSGLAGLGLLGRKRPA